MNPPTHSEAQPWTPGWWGRLAWLLIPLLLAAIITARMAGLRDSYESHTLLLFLSFTFYTLVSLGTLYLIGRSFLGLGSPGLLFLECGVIFWSLAGTVGDFVSHGDANINVTIFNTGILLAGLCHLAATILALKPQRVLRAKPLWLGVGCAIALGALWLVSQAAVLGWLPVFFIPGHGGTPVRYVVLSSAITMFVLSAGLLKVNQRGARLPFTSWYALALLMLAVGLFGVMIQLSLGSVVNWLSRTAQYLGGVYLLFAAFASLRESHLPLLPPQKQSNPAYYRDAVAVAMVLAATAIRLTFLSAMGMQGPFVTFYPAVVFASIYGGLRAGLLATVLSAIVVDYFWISPVGQFSIEQPSDWLVMITFLLSGVMIAGVSDAMHRARISASTAEKQALLATERAAAAEALQETRAKLEAALASMTDAVFISDVEGRFIDFNDAFATFHKFRNKDECAKTFDEYPDILDVFMADGTLAPLNMWAVPRALRGEMGTNVEYTLRRRDTGETWIGSYSFGPIRDKDGMIVGSVVVGRDITELKQMENALRQSHDNLENQVQERTLELEEAIETQRLLAAELLMTEVRERRRIALDLHDNICQSLAVAKLRLHDLQARATEIDLERPLIEIKEMIGDAIHHTRSILKEISPFTLHAVGLSAAIDALAEQINAKYGLTIIHESPESIGKIDEEVIILLYQATRELLLNIIKHAKVSTAFVSIQEIGNDIRVQVKDDGVGFDVSGAQTMFNRSGGFGLFNIRERLKIWDGHMEIKSGHGMGTCITISVPHKKRSQQNNRFK